MNKKQKICLWIGIIVFVLMGLFPPAEKPIDHYFRTIYGMQMEYRFLLHASGPIILSNLIVQWFIVSIITGGLIYSFKDKSAEGREIWTMNKNQLTLLWIGIAIITLMGLFPPIQYSSLGLSYNFILYAREHICINHLFLQWASSSAIIGFMIYVFKDKKTKNE
jgi:hypothetical protein